MPGGGREKTFNYSRHSKLSKAVYLPYIYLCTKVQFIKVSFNHPTFTILLCKFYSLIDWFCYLKQCYLTAEQWATDANDDHILLNWMQKTIEPCIIG